jgi:hypothetical protein
VGDKGLDFRVAHLGRVADIVEVDVAFAPVETGFFGADGVVFEADGVPSASSPQLRSGQAGQARIWSSGFLSVDIMSIGHLKEGKWLGARRVLVRSPGMVSLYVMAGPRAKSHWC